MAPFMHHTRFPKEIHAKISALHIIFHGFTQSILLQAFCLLKAFVPGSPVESIMGAGAGSVKSIENARTAV